MANRTISFGYGINDGEIVIVNSEAEIVKNIFESYVSGKQLKAIAEDLTNRKIEFLEDNCQWNKNRVDRVICNDRYIGRKGYPAIISESIFERANSIKADKSVKAVKQDDYIEYLKSIVVCAECGKRLKRIPKWVTREKWLCVGGCKNEIYVDDKVIITGIKNIISKVRLSPELLTIKSDKPRYNKTMEIVRCDNELTSIMNDVNPNFKIGKNVILQMAALKFKACDYSDVCEQESIISMIQDTSDEDIEKGNFLRKTIRQIYVSQEGKLTTEFFGGAKVRDDR